MPPISPTPTGVRIRVQLQPRASRTEVAGPHGDAIRIRVAAPPVDGAANEALLRFLAERLGVARRAVTIAAGASGRRKAVLVAGVTAAEAAAKLTVGSRGPMA